MSGWLLSGEYGRRLVRGGSATGGRPVRRRGGLEFAGLERSEGERDVRVGLAFGLGAYGYWALLFPLHLKLLNGVSPEGVVGEQPGWSLEIMGHRVVWSLALCLLLVWWLGRAGQLRELLRRRRSVMALVLTASLVSVNWTIFIYAVATEQLYRAGIGYFVTPIVQIALGVVFLGERLRRLQVASLVLASGGIGWLLVVSGQLPWIALTLASSFGLYGLVRKRADAGPIVGLTVETAVLTPLALGYLLWAWVSLERSPVFVTGGVSPTVLLVLTGVSTGLPLLWFAAAAKRLRLATIGFLQFGAPTGQFLLGVVVFGERPPVSSMWWGYGFIWLGVVCLIGEGVVRLRRDRKRARVSAVSAAGVTMPE